MLRHKTVKNERKKDCIKLEAKESNLLKTEIFFLLKYTFKEKDSQQQAFILSNKKLTTISKLL